MLLPIQADYRQIQMTSAIIDDEFAKIKEVDNLLTRESINPSKSISDIARDVIYEYAQKAYRKLKDENIDVDPQKYVNIARLSGSNLSEGDVLVVLQKAKESVFTKYDLGRIIDGRFTPNPDIVLEILNCGGYNLERMSEFGRKSVFEMYTEAIFLKYHDPYSSNIDFLVKMVNQGKELKGVDLVGLSMAGFMAKEYTRLAKADLKGLSSNASAQIIAEKKFKFNQTQALSKKITQAGIKAKKIAAKTLGEKSLSIKRDMYFLSTKALFENTNESLGNKIFKWFLSYFYLFLFILSLISILIEIYDSFLPLYIFVILIFIGLFIVFKNAYLNNLQNKRKREQHLNFYKLQVNKQDKYEEYTRKIFRNKDRILQHIKNIDLKIESLSSTCKIITENTDYNPIEALDNLKNILKINTLHEKIIWEKFYDNKEFKKINLEAIFINEIKNLETLEKPNYIDFFDEKNNISNDQKKEIIQLENQLSESLVEFHKSATNKINHFLQSYKKKYEIKGKQWLTEENKFKKDQDQFNKSIDLLKTKYYEKNKESVTKYNDFILNLIQYDQNFIRSIVVDYNPLNGVLIIEYLLPSLENFPKVKEMRYISTRNEYKEIEYSQREISSLYEDIIYRIVLDIIGITFRVDNVNAINTVVFNGWSNAINKATGLYNKACILSIVCEKKEFSQINLSEVNPKDCFKSLKGVSAHKIVNLTPIKPIISIDNNDKRFVWIY